jgi:molybdate transport system regulatory protein
MKLKNDFTPVTKVFFASPGGHGAPFLGPGTIQLLDYIAETGNVRAACQKMGMSYSKGWKLLTLMEKCLDFQVVIRKQGGRGGGDTRLSEQGIAFLENHKKFLQACCDSVEALFKEYY